MVKLLENTFRTVNIGLVNELALMCGRHGHRRLGSDRRRQDQAVRLHAVLSRARASAATASRSIPFYLSWKAKQSGFEARFIELAGQVNGAHAATTSSTRIAEALNTVQKPVNGSHVHVFGVAYKRDVDDMRESPALDIIELLKRRGAIVTYTDPFVPVLRHGPVDLTSVPLDEALAAGFDCAVIVTNHTTFDYPAIARRFPLVVDTRNALKGLRTPTMFAL